MAGRQAGYRELALTIGHSFAPARLKLDAGARQDGVLLVLHASGDRALAFLRVEKIECNEDETNEPSQVRIVKDLLLCGTSSQTTLVASFQFRHGRNACHENQIVWIRELVQR